ncbi:MAG: Rieske 2Fe-2S domain-containing protein [Boseongicola sp.]|nr:Rieske 2Fe-2S domain-containing protein [Boseongicola sp.]
MLNPFPEGWFFIARREAIERSGLLQRTWLGNQVVAWCNDAGDVCVAEAVCPHLGADLSPDAGGRVRNGCLVCPFHGFVYDASGQCVATPYAPAPKSARLRVFETSEIAGLIFAWHGIGDRPPQWQIPAPPPPGHDWSGLQLRSVRFAGHPQETTENSVDLGHLRYVHGYDSVGRVGTLVIEGACLKGSFDFKRTRAVAGLEIFKYDVSAVTNIHGLGYSFVEIREHSIGFDSRLWVLATPIDGTDIEITLVSQVRLLRSPKRPIAGMRFLPAKLRTRILNRIMISAQRQDVMQDVDIWRRKTFRPRPLLCRSDGEIMKFRRYCEQFYPDGEPLLADERTEFRKSADAGGPEQADEVRTRTG